MRLKWEPGTVTVFDNFATQHRAIGDRYPQPRVMHRVTIAGDRRLDASLFAARTPERGDTLRLARPAAAH